MPEGDTVSLAAQRLRDALACQVITGSDFRLPALATASVTGRTVLDVVPPGKHLLLRFDDARTLHTHFRMDGAWHLYGPDDRWTGGPQHRVRVLLRTASVVAVGYRLHDVALVPTIEEYRLVGHLGPDILGPDWDVDVVMQRLLARPQVEVGLALMDQRAVAGIGNLYRNEALFLSGVDPWSPVGQVADLRGVLEAAERLMQRNKARPSQSTTGEDGFGRAHYVFERGRRPCRRCGTVIRVAQQGSAPQQRVTYWCPTCQLAPSVTAG